jgi:hypothetical protein
VGASLLLVEALRRVDRRLAEAPLSPTKRLTAVLRAPGASCIRERDVVVEDDPNWMIPSSNAIRIGRTSANRPLPGASAAQARRRRTSTSASEPAHDTGEQTADHAREGRDHDDDDEEDERGE